MTRPLALLLAFLLSALPVQRAAAEAPRIFVATWRGCEDACEGFVDHIGNLDRDVDFVFRDAGQDSGTLDEIAEEARASGADLIVSWGTGVTLAIAGTLATLQDPGFNHETPQIFMIVADPVGAGIVRSLDDTGRLNLTGTYNRMPEEVMIATIRRILPGFRRLGLLYNENEPNSVLKRDELAALSDAGGFELIALPMPLDSSGLPSPEDIAPMTRALMSRGAEILHIGSSSFLRANGALLGNAARSIELPVISPYEDLVRDGHALISVAARYYDVGRLAGRLAEAILFEGRVPGSLPVARMTEFAITVNLSVGKEIGLLPPIDLLGVAEIVD